MHRCSLETHTQCTEDLRASHNFLLLLFLVCDVVSSTYSLHIYTHHSSHRWFITVFISLMLLHCVHLSWYHCSIFYTSADKYKSRNNNEYGAADKYLDQIAESLTDHFWKRMQYAFVCLSLCVIVVRVNLEHARYIYVCSNVCAVIVIIITIINYRMRCSLISFQSSFATSMCTFWFDAHSIQIDQYFSFHCQSPKPLKYCVKSEWRHDSGV